MWGTLFIRGTSPENDTVGELVRRKRTFKRGRKPGRPPIDSELEGWIFQVARDNPTLGYDKLEGKLRKLGYDMGATTIRTVLLRHGVPPAPERSRQGSSWRTFLNHYEDQFLTCVFSPSKRSLCKPCIVSFSSNLAHARCILRAVPRIQTRMGHATGAANDLDRSIILNERHLRRVLQEYTTYHNERRSHQGLVQDSPLGLESVFTQSPIHCHNILGGIIRDYYREAA